MKILVGTLYSGENEYEDCCEAIHQQSYQDFEHLVIKNLGNAEAHDRLYSTFMERSAEFDLLIKIDADMVIQDRSLFENVVEEFGKSADLDWLSIPCFDFLVGKNLGEVNTYRNVVKWTRNKGNLFTDRTHDSNTIRRRERWRAPEDHPIVIHCGNPSPYHAFHFGYHRTLKALAKGEKRSPYRQRNWRTIREILMRFESTGDRRFLYVAAGADCAIGCNLGDESTSYGHSGLNEEFEKYKQRIEIGKASWKDFKYLRRLSRIPYPWDYRVIYFYFRLKAMMPFGIF